MIDYSPRAFFVAVVALVATLALIFIVSTQPPGTAYATAAQTATAAVAATQTAAMATPHPSRRDADVRALNSMSKPGGPKLGTMLRALWHARQSGGSLAVATPGPVIDVAALAAVINGVYVTKTAASTQTITTCGNTSTAQYRKCTVCVDAAGTLAYRTGAIAASQAAATKPPCRDNEVEVAYIELPPSFTSGTTTVTAGMLQQASTTASQVQF